MNSTALEQIKKYYKIDDRIATAGQPTKDQFVTIKEAGFDLVINLALSDSPNAIQNEEELVRKQDMLYLHIPVDFKAPTLNDLQYFFDAMEKYSDKLTFVHCALNMRVSAFMYLYKTIKVKCPPTEAISDLQNVWKPDKTWESFIDTALSEYGIK